MGRVESLVADAEALPDPAARSIAQELVQALLELHAAGLANILDTLRRGGDAGRSFIDAFTRDELVASLLLLHGQHPMELDARVRQAIDRVRPTVRSHGGEVELLAVEDSAVRLRLKGESLRSLVEEAVCEAAPDAASVHFDIVALPPPPPPVPAVLALGILNRV
jgi:hypothetical protein